MRTKELRAQRAAIIENARTLISAEAPDAEAIAQFDAMMTSAEALEAQYLRTEKADAMSASLSEIAGVKAAREHISVDNADSIIRREKRIMTQLLRGGINAVSDDDKDHVMRRINTTSGIQAAAMGIGTGAGGGYAVAPEWANELLIAMKAYGGVRAVARNVRTDTGADLPWATVDDTGNVATIISENTQITEDTELALGQVKLSAYTYKSGVLLLSLQLLQDSAFDFDTVVRDAIAIRFARAQNDHFTTGTGTGQPQGVLTGAVLGATAGAGSVAGGFKLADLLGLEHSVDPSYRNGASFMFNDQTLRSIKSMVDSQQRPLFMPSLTAGAPDTLIGYPIVINQSLPTIAALSKSVLFGAFSSYLVRDVLEMQMMVLRERYADYLQVGYVAFSRSDGKLVSAANPIKWLACAAT